MHFSVLDQIKFSVHYHKQIAKKRYYWSNKFLALLLGTELLFGSCVRNLVLNYGLNNRESSNCPTCASLVECF